METDFPRGDEIHVGKEQGTGGPREWAHLVVDSLDKPLLTHEVSGESVPWNNMKRDEARRRVAAWAILWHPDGRAGPNSVHGFLKACQTGWQ